MAVSKGAEPIKLKPLDFRTVEIPVVGVTEYISHKWSEKAKRMMLEKQMGTKVRQKKEPKDPKADYESSIYRMADGSPAIPAAAFKASIVGACRMFDGLPMTVAKIAIRVNGDLVKIDGEPRMREDMVRLETGVADIRYRAGFPEWRAKLSITYNASILSLEDLVALVNAAGFGGVGEWRPSSPKVLSGSYGCFRVATEED